MTQPSNPAIYNNTGWFSLPFQADAPVKAERLYLVGGYHSLDSGCPNWGTVNDRESRFLGDCAGWIAIRYETGRIDRLPLIFGYTMWFYENWKDCPAPFQGEDALPEYTEALKRVLCLNGAFENAAYPILCIKPGAEPIQSICIEKNPEKEGKPVFWGGYFDSCPHIPFREDDPFFTSHLVTPDAPVPDEIQQLASLLTTDENKIFSYVPPEGVTHTIQFSGCPDADAASAIFRDNWEDLCGKLTNDGMIHESSKNAPSWRYNGFGTWRPKADSYHGLMFSRNHRALSLLSLLAKPEQCQKLIDYDHQKLMYFPDFHMKIGGKSIPGHWTVLINNPMWYSCDLVPHHHWPTAYTREAFGESCRNLGNLEPDGHGQVMTAIYETWRNTGRSIAWIEDHWPYLKEAAHFIQWCIENPEVSFSKHGLLYGETEGGLMEYTLYNNIPCYLGLVLYAEMANAARYHQSAKSWLRTAKQLRNDIAAYFTKGRQWDLDKTGFYHDPVTPLLSAPLGYDAKNDFPQDWYQLSQNTFQQDLQRVTGKYFIGPRGIGYDHCRITQSALLLDRPDAYEPLLKNLCKICYAPALPKPFIVPEAVTYSPEKHCFRRQGDLGNLAQQAEALQTFLMSAGVSGVHNGILKLLPRLPESWKLSIRDMRIPGSSGSLCFDTDSISGSIRTASLKLSSIEGISSIKVRLGPFSDETVLTGLLNGRTCRVESDPIQGRQWGWITITPALPQQEYELQIKEIKQ